MQQIRPVDISVLSSRRYWEAWERVGEGELSEISRRFFQKIAEAEEPAADCLLFDTTNYYTYMATRTPSELAKRGRSKEGKHHLRQVGLGLMVERDGGLPLWWCAYPGNLHDSRLFSRVLAEFAHVAGGLAGTKERLTLVMDKGMNSEANYAVAGDHHRIHFVTTYSLYYAPDLARVPLSRYSPAGAGKNKRLSEAGVARTARDVMDDMIHLHSVLSIADKGRTPVRRLEMPAKTQAEVLKALGYQVDMRGVLQPYSR